MGENREIQKGVWEGRIPVAFHLSEDDTESEHPDPVYVSYTTGFIQVLQSTYENQKINCTLIDEIENMKCNV